MIVLSEMIKDIIFGEDFSDREKVLLLKKLIVPELKVDVYTERLAKLCDADKERAKERAERRREQNRQAQQRYRESHVEEPSAPVSKVSDSKQASAGVSKSKQCKHLTDTDTATVTEDNTIKDIDRPDTDACARSRTRGGTGKKCVCPAWTMDDGRLVSGEFPTTTILRSALGRGCWRAAIDQLGEATVLGEFGVFRAEINAGEVVENPAAAFTARLKKLGFQAGRRKQGFSGVSGSVQR